MHSYAHEKLMQFQGNRVEKKAREFWQTQSTQNMTSLPAVVQPVDRELQTPPVCCACY